MERNIFSTCVIALLLLLGNRAAAQTRVVTGVITDGKVVLTDILVHEKGYNTNRVLTGDSGRFVLKLKGQSNVLVVSGTGFLTQEVAVGDGSNMQVILQSNVKGLDEVVIIGYGKTKKITNTGAVSSISGDVIRQSPSASLQNALSGRLPGLFSAQRSGQPGSDAASIQIRGVSTLNTASGGTNPLILVDDIEFSYAQLQQIDPNEVESLSILKDASTTAIYGVRGANGVIIVKTRRGRSGRPELTLRNEYGLQMPTRRPEVNDGYTTLQLLKESLLEKGTDPAIAYPQFFSGNNLDYYKDNSDPYGHPNVNWWDVLMKKATPQDRINFDISGGSRKIRYFISLGYLTQGGIFKNFTKDMGYNGNYFYNRYNFRSNIDIDPTKTLKIRVDLSGRFGTSNTPNDLPWNNGGRTFQYLWNGELSSFAFPVYNPNGSFGGVTNVSSYKPNPVANLTYAGYTRSYNNNMNVVTSATQQLGFITRGLSVNGLFSFASDNNYNKNLIRTANTIPTYVYDTKTQLYTPVITNLYRLGPLNRQFYPQANSSLLNFQASLNYQRSFRQHEVTALALFNQNSNTTNTVSSNVITPGIPTNYRGFTGRISYNFASRYMFDISMGYNGSDRFGNGKKYGFFPAGSIGWNLAEESFIKDNISFISLLKLRASYGLVGSDNISGYQYLYQQVYNSGQTGYNLGQTATAVSGVTEGTLGNAGVSWEKARKTDIGADIQLLKGDISITADYFHEYRYDILTTQGDVPATLGVGLPPSNIGRVKNSGYELEIKYTGRSGKINFWVDGQVTYARNKIIYMSEAAAMYPWLAATGHSIGAAFGYKWTGKYFQDIHDIYSSPLPATAVAMKNVYPGGLKLADLNGDGILDNNDMGYMGVNQPKYTGGFSFGISYKGFDVSALFQGAFDYIINIQRGILAYAKPDRVSTPFNLGRWTPQNAQHATYPSLAGSITDGLTSTFWYRSGDYIRFKNCEVGYAVPEKLTKKWHLKNVRVYANGYNLGLVYTALPVFIDPESAQSSSAGEYPQQRIINFGVQVGL